MKLDSWLRKAIAVPGGPKLNPPLVVQHPPLGGPVPGPYFAVTIIFHRDGGNLPKRNTPGLVGFIPVFSSRDDACAFWGADDAGAVHELLPFQVKTPSKWR